jgi:hypothetical protein
MLSIEKEITRKYLKKLDREKGVKITKELIRKIKRKINEQCNVNAIRISKKNNKNN